MKRFLASRLKAKSYKLTASPGFTLVEILVATGLFALVVSVAVGGFVSALRVQRQTTALLIANSSMSLVVEQMAREIRTATEFCAEDIRPHSDCTEVYTSPSDTLYFTNTRGERVSYSFDAGNNAIVRNGSVSGSKIITPVNVSIAFADFLLTGQQSTGEDSSGDGLAPRITLSIGIVPQGLRDPVIMQTTMSARNIDG